MNKVKLFIHKIIKQYKQVRDSYRLTKKAAFEVVQARKEAEEILKIPNRIVDVHEQFDFMGTKVTVTLDEAYVAYNMAKFCTIHRMEDGLRISTDKYYTEAEQPVRIVIIMHELGHFVNGHLDDNKNNMLLRVMKSLMGKVDIREIQADDYAISVLGVQQVADALSYMYKIHPSYELYLRHKRLLIKDDNGKE